MRRKIIGLSVTLLLLLKGSATPAEFTPLGFQIIPSINGNYISVSEDGSVVVGLSILERDSPRQLVQWTRSTGLSVLLNDTPELAGLGAQISMAGDGSVIASERLASDGSREPIRLIHGNLEVLPIAAGVEVAQPLRISQDGSTIWGRALPDSLTAEVHAIRWTDEGVKLIEGPPPAPPFDSPSLIPNATSADGTVFVGTSRFDAVRWTEEAGLHELFGFGVFEEVVWPLGLSSDGRWAVGRVHDTRSATHYQAARWDGLAPPERLLPSVEGWGAAGLDVTADGSVVVGRLYLADELQDRRSDIAAGIWTEDDGQMVPLQYLLVTQYGLGDRLDGYHLTTIVDMSDDGRFMVGHMINPDGLDEAFLVDLGPSLLLPGDYSDNGTVEQADLDLLGIEIAAGTNNVVFDLNGDQLVNAADRDVFLGGDLISSGNKLNGDADFDGQVQFPDFVILSSNFGKSGVWSQGDFDVDGVVQFGDFVILSHNFGQSAGAAAAVPEPATTTLLSLTCLVGLVAFGRRRCSHTSKGRVVP